MKKFITSLLFVFILLNFALALNVQLSYAANEDSGVCAVAPFSPECILTKVGKNTNLPSFEDTTMFGETGAHPSAPTDELTVPGVATAISPVYYAIDVFRLVISGILFIVIIVMAFKLISDDSGEEFDKTKKQLVYMIIGLVVIQLAATIVKKMFFGEYGEAFEVNPDTGSSNAGAFGVETLQQIRGVVSFIEYMLGAVAVFFIVLRGVQLMTSGLEDDALDKAKRHVIYAAAGLVIIGVSETLIQTVIFPEFGQTLPNISKGAALAANLTNFVAGFVAIAAFAMFFYAGYLYVASGGNDEVKDKVKKIFTGALIGIVLALGAFAISNTLVKFDPGEDSSTNQDSLQVED